MAALAVFIAGCTLVTVLMLGSDDVSAEVYSNEVGFINVDTADNDFALVSVPLTLLGDNPHYGLNNVALTGPGEIGQMLAADLTGSTSFDTADQIRYFDGATYRVAWLYYNPNDANDAYNNLWLEGFAVSTLTLEPHQGFWVLRVHAGDPDTVTFLGGTRTDTPVGVAFETGWSMFSWPYPTDHALQTSTMFADGAHASDSFDTADRIGAYTPGVGYEWHWLYTDGTWYKQFTPSTLALKPKQGLWYYRQSAAGGPFTWSCIKPY